MIAFSEILFLYIYDALNLCLIFVVTVFSHLLTGSYVILTWQQDPDADAEGVSRVGTILNCKVIDGSLYPVLQR